MGMGPSWFLCVVDGCVAGADWRATGSGARICPCCMHRLFGILFSLDVCVAWPGCSGEGLGPSTGQCALPSLGVRWEWGGRVFGIEGGGSGNLDWYFFRNLIFKRG